MKRNSKCIVVPGVFLLINISKYKLAFCYFDTRAVLEEKYNLKKLIFIVLFLQGSKDHVGDLVQVKTSSFLIIFS